jgi:phosphonatase-like hydrolase
MQFKLVVFDIAGTTLHDSNFVAQAIIQAFQKQGLDFSLEVVGRVMGYHKPQAIRMLLNQVGDSRAQSDEFVDQVHESFLAFMVEFYATSPEVREIEGASEVFAWFQQQGIAVGLDTGFGRTVTDTILQRVSWVENRLVDAVACSDEVPEGRPAPHMIHRLMEATGVTDVQAVIKVGDTLSDLLEGANTGCGLTVGVLTGAYTEAELAAFDRPKVILPSIRELPTYLSSISLN